MLEWKSLFGEITKIYHDFLLTFSSLHLPPLKAQSKYLLQSVQGLCSACPACAINYTSLQEAVLPEEWGSFPALQKGLTSRT